MTRNKNKINEVRLNASLVRIGKKGITDELIEEIDLQLSRREVIKIRYLLDISKQDLVRLAKGIASSMNVNLVEVRGKTFILSKN
ncbi:MAG: YhbY family RNA-binding protein [Candidatus Heimdallarchaeota archaeon]|nr:YhbY family RNA-binding protein [Candidatus Heimdallarchaeota archaeon]MCK5049104.1 YhbY family RNA-binding protein [Candidatus Heimdallarchaeota archaeon]